ncbi:hypothetical protein PPL_11429 [Heterostelium album PN500]|uniref:Uncharacterized protein n=1 Tax=Heterostelium pallidum (strain ATCC 26659 / Pp 5 / PN500) TaxID=670386 RepID=D3BTD5_HETP5|nr:hypothetical protein PPL_11429 [Heterostelium album PN500]EFA75352.1 hypothetical protein PPL_11429 [Heterostelium album PN500]|eukprot:XP_020427486.1 hypothetical protein PPL_11429 [Heterostelium album PN500]
MLDRTQTKTKEIEGSLKELVELYNEDINALKEEIKNLEIRKAAFLDVKKAIDISLIPDPITLNVGGMKFQTSKSTLTKIPGSYFDAMLSGQIDIQSVSGKPNNTFFIDRDGTHFRYILNFLRDGDTPIPDSVKPEVSKEMKFYKLVPPTQSDLITHDQFKIINGWLGGELSYELIYKGTKDGFESANFHTKCNGKGATLTVVKSSDGNVFGGYNSQSWNSNGAYCGDNKCFIYTMVNKNNIVPTKYAPIGNNTNIVYGNNGYGPTFGSGHDLYISNQCNVNQQSYQNFPHCYADTTGKAKATFATTYNFTVSEIEVFTVL